MNVPKYCIIEAGSIFDSVIVRGEIPPSDIPVVKYSILFRPTKEKAAENIYFFSRFIDAILLEIGEYLITLYNIPMK